MAYWPFVTSGRLTRNELGWLLAQEARGAAKILRQDVTALTQPPPAPAEVGPATAVPDLRVQSTLNLLDDAIGMLSELEAAPGSKGGRRGRIDLAALLWELSPNASISIEPGAGAEVFGEEAELRRMLHVMLSQTNFAAGGRESDAAPLHVRREGEWVRISAELGPDISASADLERRWLARMATRMGGELALVGGTLAVRLPADASNDQNEVADLRKELEQAQQLGEAYARELATVFAAGALPDEVAAPQDVNDVAARRLDLLVGVSRALNRLLAPVFRGIQADIARLPDPSHALAHQVSAGYEAVGELGRIAECPPSEPVEPVQIAEAMAAIVAQAEGRGARHGVRVTLSGGSDVTLQTRPKAFSLLARTLVDHAIAATPRGGKVTVELSADGAQVFVSVKDGGAAVPPQSRADLLEQRVDPASLGRPPGISLAAAHTVVNALGGTLILRDPPDGGLTVEARLRGL
jgi:two-component system OmpR family sensor kinase